MIFKNTEFNNVYPEPCNQKQKQPPKVFCKKRCFRNFAKFTGKHLCQSLFFNKVASLRLATVLKKRPWRRCFPMNFEKFLRTPILKNTSWLLLLQKELLRKKPNESGQEIITMLPAVHEGLTRKINHFLNFHQSYLALQYTVIYLK